ncbi:thiol reductant ABC exporter subunit CydC [Amycolatopsis rhabdoformis]|uniref:Thiol reductant ABC exporter subunit CydC n=1 Tax=Amycolatopsis rhabdoformis TaxID=1448059 RepID=A0ABZ1ILC4_9PSEU|nr:thiol reductant ABC exporter subunit CydC [Amycolatopsis rhabdoformis]WSE35339.1 thiol reductant ABC exporter subunit CydC [Amycolatopsis rhabdoformis]
MDQVRPGKGPLGALSALGPAARRALLFVAALSFVNAAFLVAQAFLLADVLAALVSAGTGGRTAQLAALFALVAGRALVGWAVRVVSARAAATAQQDLRAKVVSHALRLGPEWLARRGDGSLTELVTRGLDALDAYFREYLPALVTAFVVPLAAGAAILWTDWPSAVIVVATVPLLPLFAVLVGKFTADRVAGATDAVHRMSGLLLELVRALPILTAFHRADAQSATVARVSDRHRRATLKTLRVAFSSAFVLELVATLSVALVAVVIGVRLVSGSLPLAIGLGVLILVPECYQPLRAVGAAFHASEDGVEAVRRVGDVLAEPAPSFGKTVPPCGQLTVSDLSVARRGGFAPDGSSFTVSRGETVWLRAPSGGGKSTTLAAVLGFVPAYDGSITVGGVPLGEVDVAKWRADVAWVPQSPVFSGGTVFEEVAVGGLGGVVGVGVGSGAAAGFDGSADAVGPIGFGSAAPSGRSGRLGVVPGDSGDGVTAAVRGVLGATEVVRAAEAGHSVGVGGAGEVGAAAGERGSRGAGQVTGIGEVAAAGGSASTSGASEAVDSGNADSAAGVRAGSSGGAGQAAGFGEVAAAGGWVSTSGAGEAADSSSADSAAGVRSVDASVVVEVLAELGLAGLEDRSVDQLSVGQRQRVAVARALVRVRAGAWLLLLDEPTAHLDEVNARRVLGAVERAVAGGAAAIVAAHERAAAVAVGDEKPLSGTAVAGEVAAGRPLAWRLLLDRRLFAGSVLGALALLAGVALTATSGWLIAKASLQPPILTLTVAVVGVRAFGLGRAGLRYAERLVTHDAAFRIVGRLRVRLWEALVRLGPARALAAGEGQRRLVADVDAVRDLLPRVVSPPIVVGLVAVGAIAVQTVVLPSAGLLLVAAVVVSLAAPRVALLTERHATAALAAGRRDVAARVLVLFSSAAELLAYGGAAARRRALFATDANLTAATRRQAFGAGAADALIVLATGAAAVGSTMLAAPAVASGALAGVMVPLLALVPLALAEVLSLLPPAATHWDTLRAARLRLGALDSAAPVPPGKTGPAVRLRRADLGWPGAEPVLRDVTLDIAPGTYVAVVGPSGAGKSTLVAALLGFLPPRAGEVEVPAHVSWAPQEPMLVSTTVAENLRLADPHATDTDIRHALDLAHLPELDPTTLLDSAGTGLSGGQAQRVALARALLAAPSADLVLLDEPTAHLDEGTARALRTTLRTELAGRTVVHVTHNVDEQLDADVVLEVRGGRVEVREVEPVSAAVRGVR